MKRATLRWEHPFHNLGAGRASAWAGGAEVLVAAWLIITAVVFGPSPGAEGGSWNSLIVGIVIAILGAWRPTSASEERARGRVNAVLAVWMVSAPLVFDYTTDPTRTWSSITAGFIILVLGSTTPRIWTDETHTTRSD